MLGRIIKALSRRRYRVQWNKPQRRTLYQRIHLARINDDVRRFAQLNRKGR